jgi:hypothetical protein
MLCATLVMGAGLAGRLQSQQHTVFLGFTSMPGESSQWGFTPTGGRAFKNQYCHRDVLEAENRVQVLLEST